ncbi:MAG: hypothetical protein IKD70_10225 [Eggerthellaceae bacterium]|nr:hypothetical protein [Eggerthellaceae bacterium]
MKVHIFSKRQSSWQTALAKTAALSFSDGGEASFFSDFQTAVRNGSDFIVIDSGYIQNVRVATDTMLAYARTRNPGIKTEVIFIAPDDMGPSPLIQTLVTVGYYNIILPALESSNDESPFAQVPRILARPYTFRVPYEKGLISVPAIDAMTSSQPKWASEEKPIGAKVTTVAIASLKPRSGATTLALSLASSFALSGKDASIVMNARDFDTIRASTTAAPNEFGAIRFRPSKGRLGHIDIWPIQNDMPYRHSEDGNSICIFDLGTVFFAEAEKRAKRGIGPDARDNYISTWATARASILVMGSGYTDIFELGRTLPFLRQRGFSEDLFVNLCPVPQFELLKESLSAAKGLTAYRIETVENPMYLTQVPSFIQNWAKESLGADLKGKA